MDVIKKQESVDASVMSLAETAMNAMWESSYNFFDFLTFYLAVFGSWFVDFVVSIISTLHIFRKTIKKSKSTNKKTNKKQTPPTPQKSIKNPNNNKKPQKYKQKNSITKFSEKPILNLVLLVSCYSVPNQFLSWTQMFLVVFLAAFWNHLLKSAFVAAGWLLGTEWVSTWMLRVWLRHWWSTALHV